MGREQHERIYQSCKLNYIHALIQNMQGRARKKSYLILVLVNIFLLCQENRLSAYKFYIYSDPVPTVKMLVECLFLKKKTGLCMCARHDMYSFKTNQHSFAHMSVEYICTHIYIYGKALVSRLSTTQQFSMNYRLKVPVFIQSSYPLINRLGDPDRK